MPGMSPAMTPSQAFRERGILFPISVLAPAELARARAVVERMEASLGRERMSVPLKHAHLENADIWALATHPRVIDAVETALGPDLVLISTSFFIKYPAPSESRNDG
jgi:hypothetical protein